MAKSTPLAAVVETLLGEMSQRDLATMAEALAKRVGTAPKPQAAKALITVRISEPEDQKKYNTVATIWKIKGDFEKPMVGIRDYDDLVSLIEDLQVAEMELRPEEDDSEEDDS